MLSQQLLSLALIGIQIYSWAIIIYLFMSWVPATRETGIGRFLGQIVEPYLSFFRKFIPPLGMIDFSPIVALLVLQILIRGGVIYLFSMFTF